MKNHEPNKLPGIGRFSTLPATWIDEIYTRDSKNFFYYLWYSLQIRFIYVFIFIPMVVIDFFLATGAIIGNVIKSIFTKNREKSKQLKERRTELAEIIRNTVVVILFGILGIISPKFVIKYFTPNENELYDDKEDQLPAYKIESPKHEDDLSNKINHAVVNNIKFIISSDTHMQELADNEKILDLKEFNTIDIAKDDKSVRVGAGVRWFDLQKTLNARRLALEVMHEDENGTIADAVAVNAHCHMLRSDTVASAIIKIEMVNAKGEYKHVIPGSELFKLVTGGQHLFGAVTHVVFRVVPNNLLKYSAETVLFPEYDKYFNKIKSDKTIVSHQLELSIDPSNLFNSGIAINYREKKSNPVISKLEESKSKTNRDTMLENLAKSSKVTRKMYSSSEANHSLRLKDLYVARNDIVRPFKKLNSHALVSESVWLREYFIPLERITEFMEALADIVKKNRVVLLKASIHAYHSEAGLSLNPTFKGEAFAVSIRFNQLSDPQALKKTEDWLTQVQGAALSVNGTYRLQDQTTFALSKFRQANKKFDEVFAAKKRFDRNSVFINPFFKEITTLLTAAKEDPVETVNSTQKGKSRTVPAAATTVYGEKGFAANCSQFATNASNYATEMAAKAEAERQKKEESKLKRRKLLNK